MALNSLFCADVPLSNYSLTHAFEEIHWRWCRHNTVPLSHIMSTVSDSVIIMYAVRRPKG